MYFLVRIVTLTTNIESHGHMIARHPPLGVGPSSCVHFEGSSRITKLIINKPNCMYLWLNCLKFVPLDRFGIFVLVLRLKLSI